MSQQLVLIVDDDERCRHELAADIQGLKLGIDEAEGSDQALSKIESRIFDLVLLDITLSGMDGWQTLRRLRHIHLHSRAISKLPSWTCPKKSVITVATK
jgi:CheY-like chemotaxis protein